jgi:hypothetical protein
MPVRGTTNVVDVILLTWMASMFTVTTDAHAVVLCQKGARLKLRRDAFVGREISVRLDANTLSGRTLQAIVPPLVELQQRGFGL